MNEVLNYVLSAVCNPTSLIMVLAGTCMGLIFGSLPGLSATMAVALLIPMTFTLEPVPAIGAMLGAYVGGMAGGAVASILLNIPGTPSAVVTTFDGYPMSKNGRAAEALGWAAFASGGLPRGRVWASRRYRFDHERPYPGQGRLTASAWLYRCRASAHRG